MKAVQVHGTLNIRTAHPFHAPPQSTPKVDWWMLHKRRAPIASREMLLYVPPLLMAHGTQLNVNPNNLESLIRWSFVGPYNLHVPGTGRYCLTPHWLVCPCVSRQRE